MKWCEHLKGDYFEVSVKSANPSYPIIQYWPISSSLKFCPICGKPRPEKEKELWEKFYAVWEKGSPIVNLHKFTHVALEHFLEVVDKTYLPYGNDSIRLKIQEAMRQSVGGSE